MTDVKFPTADISKSELVPLVPRTFALMAGTKRIFFDTNIFNQIIDRSDATELIGRLRRAETDCEIGLVTGIHVIEELSATSNPDKRQRLAECVLVLGSGKIIKSWNQLMREEFLSCLQEQEPSSVFCEDRKQQFYCTVLKDIAAGRFSDQCARLQQEMKEEKKRALQWQKRLRKQEKNIVGVDPCSKYQTFDEFYEQVWRSASSSQVRKLLRMDGIGESKLDEAVLRVVSKQDTLPHLNAFLRATPALCWVDHVGWKQRPRHCAGPKWGDRTDLRHFLCAAAADVLVSDDEKARAVFGLVYPGKTTLTLEGFSATLGKAEAS